MAMLQVPDPDNTLSGSGNLFSLSATEVSQNTQGQLTNSQGLCCCQTAAAATSYVCSVDLFLFPSFLFDNSFNS